ncbi:MAG: hypothetical protein KQI35_05835 [Bacteroidetes bacterium]|nr:hypothetical protein [Bacteroidota bacterium]
MKSYLVPTVLSILILAGCSSTKKAADYDDVYASTKKDKNTGEQTADPDYYVQNENATADYSVEDYEAGDYVSYEEEPVYSETETVENPDGSTYITNNYYGSSPYDYYDYSYAARINRFYSPYAGFGYYSPYYTGFYYDPWYNPYWYSPSLYFGFSWGWGSIGWGYPYYSYYPYYPYNSYWYGYNNGYWNGYWNGYYNGGGYYNDYYGYNGYYGHRSSRSGGSSTPVAANSRSRSITPVNRASTYLTMQRNNDNNGISAKSKENGRSNALVVDPSTRSEQTAQTRNAAGTMTKPQNDVSKRTQTTSASRYTYKKPAESGKTRTEYRPGETINTRSKQTSSRTQPSQRYAKPSGTTTERSLGNTQQSRSSNTQVYSRPKSNYNNSYSKPSTYTNRKNVQPSNNNSQRYSQPARSNTNTRSYSQPSRSNTRSYSTPSRSSNSRSYSTPSRSSSSRSSYSAPSRSSSSGSSSGGGSRSSSSSRGGRR